MKTQDPFLRDLPLPRQFGSELLALERGEGCYLIDVAGNRYLDFGAGIAVNALGYGREDLARVAYEQMRKLAHVSNLFTTRPAVDLARTLVATGDFAAVHFGNSGSEANEAALKYARLYAQRRRGAGHEKLLCFDGAFHGRTMGALSVTPTPKYQAPFVPLIPGIVELPYNDEAALERTLDASFAGVIVEVVQGEGGLRTMTPSFARALNAACRRHDVILVADEVQTGLGRTGYPYACALVGLVPDIVTLAKPLGGGLPLSATLIPAKVNDLLHPGEHGTTFGGGPVTTAVSAKVVETLLEPEFLEEVRSKSQVLDAGLESLRARFDFLGELRGAGMLRGLQVSEARTGSLPELLARIREKGLVVLRSGADIVRIAPPLVISREEIAQGIGILESVFSQC